MTENRAERPAPEVASDGTTERSVDVPQQFKYIGRGIYGIGEAARLIGLTRNRVSRWTHGYHYKEKGKLKYSTAIIGNRDPKSDESTSLSFADLVEVVFMDHFLRHGVHIRVVRQAAEEGRKKFNTEHPFATHRFMTDGKSILSEIRKRERGRAVDVLYNILTDQIEMKKVLQKMLKGDLEFDGRNVLLRWWPLGFKKSVVIDPMRRFGAPIVDRAGIPTRLLWLGVKGGSSARAIADWYDIPLKEVRDAVTFETSRA